VTKKVVRAKGCDIVVNGVGEGGYVPGKEYDIVFSHYITSGKMAVGVSAGTLQMGESDIDAGASICSLLVSGSLYRGWMKHTHAAACNKSTSRKETPSHKQLSSTCCLSPPRFRHTHAFETPSNEISCNRLC
jgi:hypothetical protein